MHWLACVQGPRSVWFVGRKLARGGARGSPIEMPRVGASTGSELARTMSVHAAGLLSTRPVVDAHGTLPSGVEATPGAAPPRPACTLQAAPGPDAGHCSAPAGTLMRASSPTDVAPHPANVSAAAAPAAQTEPTVLFKTRLAVGAAARATTLKWFETTTNASARCALGRDLISETRCRSKCN